MTTEAPVYQIDAKWTITDANEEFCRLFRGTEAALIGRDVRDLVRHDWRPDFRTYVAKALVGTGEAQATVPMVAPCGEQRWFKHTLEPVMTDGLLHGYRATVIPHVVRAAMPKPRWWAKAAQVWNFDAAA